jgi:hypothetical protein
MVMLDRDAVEKILPEAHEALCQGISPAKKWWSKHQKWGFKHETWSNNAYIISIQCGAP